MTGKSTLYVSEDAPIVYDKTLKCGECIAGGFNFCWKRTVPAEVLGDKDFPVYNANKDQTESICCQHNADQGNC